MLIYSNPCQTRSKLHNLFPLLITPPSLKNPIPRELRHSPRCVADERDLNGFSSYWYWSFCDWNSDPSLQIIFWHAQSDIGDPVGCPIFPGLNFQYPILWKLSWYFQGLGVGLNCLTGTINWLQPAYLLSQGLGWKPGSWVLRGTLGLWWERRSSEWWHNIPENSPGDRFWLNVIITWRLYQNL